MSRIFISYRRDESAAICARLADRLAARFGRDAVVRDVFQGLESIPPGSGLEQFLDNALALCAVQLVLIGPRWLAGTNGRGERRLDDPTDVVRLEIEMALRRGLVVIPLLVGGGAAPDAGQLPPGLRELAGRNGMPLRDDPDFEGDAGRVSAALEQWIDVRPTQPGAAGQPVLYTYAALPGVFTAEGRARPRRAAFVAPVAAAVLALALILSSVAVAASAQRPGSLPRAADPTVAAGQGPTPTLPPGIIYQDPLTTGAPGWTSNPHCFPGPDGYHVTDGRYLCGPLFTDSNVPVASDATITALAKQTKGDPRWAYGLVFRENAVFGWYHEFFIAADGHWGAGRSDGAKWTYDVNWTASGAIHQGIGATNELKAHLFGQQLDFYVNGVHVGAAKDTTSNSNGSDASYGFAGSDGIEAVFSDLKVTDPSIT